MKRQLLLSFLTVIFCQCFWVAEGVAKERDLFPALVQTAKTLPSQGVIMRQGSGFVYVKVSDKFIHQLFEQQDLKGFQKPPYFRRKNAPGAHISVLYEHEFKRLSKAPAVGEEISFTITGDKIVQAGHRSYYVLTIDAPKLERYRLDLGLSKWLNHHAFHITVAAKEH